MNNSAFINIYTKLIYMGDKSTYIPIITVAIFIILTIIILSFSKLYNGNHPNLTNHSSITKQILQGTIPDTIIEKRFPVPSSERKDSQIVENSQGNSDFPPLPKPSPGDWLAEHDEPGQSLEEFLHSKHNIPDKKRRIIYLLPIEAFHKQNAPSLKKLKEFTHCYFQLPVTVLKPPKKETVSFTSRKNPYTLNKQYLTEDIINYLIKIIPSDAFCVIAITMIDLYPTDSWNYVFGIATFTERVGVFSFARYTPEFPGSNYYPDMTKQKRQTLLLKRSCKIISHETGHMFGLMHCRSYHCNMNGSNSLRESDSQPLYLCPICLNKLRSSVGFSDINRYQQLKSFYRENSFKKENKWTGKRIKTLSKATHPSLLGRDW